MNEIKPLKHQNQLSSAIMNYDKIRFFFFIGGYRCGKSFTIVMLIFYLAKKYENQDVTIGLGSPTISMMKKTFLLDFQKICKKFHLPYCLNQKDNILIFGGVMFVFVATSFPANIYAYTFNAFLNDEMDELPQHHGIDSFTAIDERCSKTFPDGRPPFIANFTTAQGYKTAYITTRNLKDKKIPFILIRGKTKDNPHNDPAYYETRYKLYTKNERLAYLEGHFVNLTTGRVYPEFDEDECTIEPFEIKQDDNIFVGQDKNIGFNKAVCYVKRDKLLYMIKAYSFALINYAPGILRKDFPQNSIFWYPDATAKEILAGYSNEIKRHNINLRVGTFNPSILARIFAVNKLHMTKRIKIFKGNEQFCIALKTRCFDSNGVPEKRKGEHAPDHFCDANEYVLWRIVMQDPDFADIKNATSSVK